MRCRRGAFFLSSSAVKSDSMIVRASCRKFGWSLLRVPPASYCVTMRDRQARLCALMQVLDVMCSVAAVNLMRAHPMSRALYNIVVTYLISELHSGRW